MLDSKGSYMTTLSNHFAKILFFVPFHRNSNGAAAGSAIFSKTAQTLLFFVFLATLPYALPGLDRYRVLVPSPLANIFKNPNRSTQVIDPGKTESLTQQTVGNITTDASTKIRTSDQVVGEDLTNIKIEPKPGEIEDPSGKALNRF